MRLWPWTNFCVYLASLATESEDSEPSLNIVSDAVMIYLVVTKSTTDDSCVAN